MQEQKTTDMVAIIIERDNLAAKVKMLEAEIAEIERLGAKKATINKLKKANEQILELQCKIGQYMFKTNDACRNAECVAIKSERDELQCKIAQYMVEANGACTNAECAAIKSERDEFIKIACDYANIQQKNIALLHANKSLEIERNRYKILLQESEERYLAAVRKHSG